jgi:hypothetical protein
MNRDGWEPRQKRKFEERAELKREKKTACSLPDDDGWSTTKQWAGRADQTREDAAEASVGSPRGSWRPRESFWLRHCFCSCLNLSCYSSFQKLSDARKLATFFSTGLADFAASLSSSCKSIGLRPAIHHLFLKNFQAEFRRTVRQHRDRRPIGKAVSAISVPGADRNIRGAASRRRLRGI